MWSSETPLRSASHDGCGPNGGKFGGCLTATLLGSGSYTDDRRPRYMTVREQLGHASFYPVGFLWVATRADEHW